MDNIKQTATFNSATTYTFTSLRGITVTIDGTCLRKNENSVTGTVPIKFIEMYDRATMAITKKPTLGIDANGDLVSMDSTGEFNVRVTQKEIATSANTKIIFMGKGSAPLILSDK